MGQKLAFGPVATQLLALEGQLQASRGIPLTGPAKSELDVSHTELPQPQARYINNLERARGVRFERFQEFLQRTYSDAADSWPNPA